MRAGRLDERLLLKLLVQGKQAGTQGGAKETEVTDLHKATGEDMLQETVNEFFSRERAVFELAGLGSPILESDQGRFHVSGVHHLGETAIANGHAVDIGSQIFESGLSIANRLAMHHPVFVPDPGWDLGKDGCFTQEVLETSPKQLGQRWNRQEVLLARLAPSMQIRIQAATRNQIVNMGMVNQITRPGMQYAHQTNLAAYETWIASQDLSGLGRSSEERVVEELLVSAGKDA